MKMKRCLILAYLLMVSMFAFAQPPMPNSHGGWRSAVASPDMPAAQKYYFDINTQQFQPYSTGAPLGGGTALLFGLLGGYVGVKVLRTQTKRK